MRKTGSTTELLGTSTLEEGEDERKVTTLRLFRTKTRKPEWLRRSELIF
jgi:hypothetical protein